MMRRILPTLFMSALGALAGLAAVPTAHAQEPPLPVRPALSEDADAALAALNKTLSASDLSFTARTSRVYLNEVRTAASHLPYDEGSRAPSGPAQNPGDRR